MKDGKTVSQRIREYVAMERLSDDYLAAAAAGSQRVAFVRGMSAMADEIEAEIEAARQTSRWYEVFRDFAAEELERPMLEGESVLMWLKRNYIAIPADKEGEPWAIGDVCRLKDSDLPGDVFGYEVSVYGQVLVEVLVGTNLMAYDASALSRIERDTQERINEDARKSMNDYWGCAGVLCSECPARIDGANPPERFGVGSCIKAQSLDLLRRQRELEKAGAPCQ